MNCEQILNIQINEEKHLLIDIREHYEYQDHNIGGRHIPMGEILNRLDEIPRDILVIIHCQSGARGAKMTKVLHSMGFNNVENLDGGLDAFSSLQTTQVQTK